MNDIFYPYMKFSIVYLDDILIFPKSIDQHIQHINKFIEVKKNGLVSTKKIKFFQTNVRFLRFEIYQETTTPIQRLIEFLDKFLDKIKDKVQLQRFLGYLNYISKFIPKIRVICQLLYQRS